MVAEKYMRVITSTYCVQGSFAVGRLLSIPLATWFTPNFMLLCNIVSLRCLRADVPIAVAVVCELGLNSENELSLSQTVLVPKNISCLLVSRQFKIRQFFTVKT